MNLFHRSVIFLCRGTSRASVHAPAKYENRNEDSDDTHDTPEIYTRIKTGNLFYKNIL